MLQANTVGAIVVFVFANFVIPTPDLPEETEIEEEGHKRTSDNSRRLNLKSCRPIANPLAAAFVSPEGTLCS